MFINLLKVYSLSPAALALRPGFILAGKNGNANLKVAPANILAASQCYCKGPSCCPGGRPDQEDPTQLPAVESSTGAIQNTQGPTGLPCLGPSLPSRCWKACPCQLEGPLHWPRCASGGCQFQGRFWAGERQEWVGREMGSGGRGSDGWGSPGVGWSLRMAVGSNLGLAYWAA